MKKAKSKSRGRRFNFHYTVKNNQDALKYKKIFFRHAGKIIKINWLIKILCNIHTTWRNSSFQNAHEENLSASKLYSKDVQFSFKIEK